MALVSKYVQVLGIPGVDRVDYDGWRLRRRNEFEQELLGGLTYRNPKLLHAKANEIGFNVNETMRANKGPSIHLNKDVVIARERDEQWRIVLEKIQRIEVK
jgi:hypothetical protein